MRQFWLYILAVIVANVLPSAAAANCRVIHMLDEMHIAQQRLVQNPQTPSFMSDIRLLRRNNDSLSDQMILDSIGRFALSPQGVNTLHYTDMIDELLNQTSIDDPDTASRHFQDQRVLQGMDRMDGYLEDLRCSPSEVAASQMPEPKEEDFGKALRAAIKEDLDWHIALFGGALIGSLLLLRLWRQRRVSA